MSSDLAYRVTAEAPIRTIHVSSDPGSCVRLSFENDCDNDTLFDTFQNLVLPLNEESAICVRYALTELAANAIRASRDRHVSDPVCLTIRSESKRLCFELKDSAKGFDPAILPYDLYGSEDDIDLESEAFDAYRARCGMRRFGLGLIMARQAVEDFRLSFLDTADQERAWTPDGMIKGTVVRFGMKMKENT